MPRDTFHNLSKEKQESITEAAIREFARKGYKGSSMHNISLGAGVAKGSMYQYFLNKEELFSYVFSKAVKEKIRFVRNLLEQNHHLPFFQQLERICRESQGYAREHPHMYYLYLKGIDEAPAEIRQILTGILESEGPEKQYDSLVGNALGKREIREDMDVDFVAFVVQGLLDEFSYNPVLDDAEEKTQQLLDFLRKGLSEEEDSGRNFNLL